ncbi:C-5 cytosine-specific DNA methylase [anaerobic digester metagenome]
MMTEQSRIDSSKWFFFNYSKKKGLAYKGDFRAFVGVLTWKYELESDIRDPNKRHWEAFHRAVTECKGYSDKSVFYKDLEALLSEWKGRGDTLERHPCHSPLVVPPVKDVKRWSKDGLTLVSLFSGAFGLDLGFMGAGFEPKVALDIEKSAEQTVCLNLPHLPFITDDVKEVTTERILKEGGLEVGELDVVTGGPPCQPFSTAGSRMGLNDPRASPLVEFVRFVKEARPKFFVMEEVTGLLSARLRHIPIADRNGRVLQSEEQTGSVFSVVVDMLRKTGYNLTLSEKVDNYKDSVLNAADYGAPQERNRLIIIGARDTVPSLPEPTHSYKPMSTVDGKVLRPWNTFWDATCDLQGREMEYTKLSAKGAKYLRMVPPGGNWRHLPDELLRDAMGGAYASGGGKMGYFRRLSWDFPSPTVTTAPAQMATMLCHPDELRPMSVEEYKRVQGFPDDWEIPGSTATKYKLIGNAVPVYLSYAIAQQIRRLLDG